MLEETRRNMPFVPITEFHLSQRTTPIRIVSVKYFAEFLVAIMFLIK